MWRKRKIAALLYEGRTIQSRLDNTVNIDAKDKLKKKFTDFMKKGRSITPDLIRKCALKTKGAADPSCLDGDDWRNIFFFFLFFFI